MVSERDFIDIRLAQPLIETVNTTYLSIINASFIDIVGYSGIDIPQTNALKVSGHDLDLTAPVLLSFNLDLNIGVMLLTFNQPVNSSTTLFSRMTLQNAQMDPLANYTLTAGNSSSTDIAILELEFSEFDLNQIKADQQLAVNGDSTFISAISGFVRGTTNKPSLLYSQTKPSK